MRFGSVIFSYPWTVENQEGCAPSAKLDCGPTGLILASLHLNAETRYSRVGYFFTEQHFVAAACRGPHRTPLERADARVQKSRALGWLQAGGRSVPADGRADEVNLDGLLGLGGVVILAVGLPTRRDDLDQHFALTYFGRTGNALLIGF